MAVAENVLTQDHSISLLTFLTYLRVEQFWLIHWRDRDARKIV